jgi:hypothetical protein
MTNIHFTIKKKTHTSFFSRAQWLAEKEKINNERLESNLAKQDRNSYLMLEQGENKFTLLPIVPTPRTSNWGQEQDIFKVQKNGNEYDGGVSVKSPLYIKIARLMPKAPVEVTIVRVGEGKQTRLSLLEK